MYKLDKELPREVRFPVYKKALEIYKSIIKDNSVEFAGMGVSGGIGLCMILPCILWNLNDYLDNAPDGNHWSFLRTSTAFPEIKEYIPILEAEMDSLRRVYLRIEILEKILNNGRSIK